MMLLLLLMILFIIIVVYMNIITTDNTNIFCIFPVFDWLSNGLIGAQIGHSDKSLIFWLDT